jgi:Cysteine rich repeat
MLARKLGLALLSAYITVMTGTGWAQQPAQAQSGAIQQACRSDYQSYCSSTPIGGGAVFACLRQHSSSLSPGCAQAISGIPGTAAPVSPPGSAGYPPAGALPPVYAPTPEAPRAYAPPVNPSAPNRQAQIAAFQTACGGDFRRLCGGTQPDGGRVIACLSGHQSELSPSCQQTLMSLRAGR